MRKLIVAASLFAGILAAGSASAAGIAASSAPQVQSPLLHQVDESLGDVLRWRMRELGLDDDRDRPRYRERWNDDDDRMSRSEYRRRLDRLEAERRDLQRDWRQDRADRRDDDWRRRHRNRYE